MNHRCTGDMICKLCLAARKWKWGRDFASPSEGCPLLLFTSQHWNGGMFGCDPSAHTKDKAYEISLGRAKRFLLVHNISPSFWLLTPWGGQRSILFNHSVALQANAFTTSDYCYQAWILCYQRSEIGGRRQPPPPRADIWMCFRKRIQKGFPCKAVPALQSSKALCLLFSVWFSYNLPPPI